MHAIELAAAEIKIRMDEVDAHILELHKDVKNLLGFKANLLGWAVGSSGVISLSIAMLTMWFTKH